MPGGRSVGDRFAKLTGIRPAGDRARQLAA